MYIVMCDHNRLGAKRDDHTNCYTEVNVGLIHSAFSPFEFPKMTGMFMTVTRVNIARESSSSYKLLTNRESTLHEDFRDQTNDGRVPKSDFEDSHGGKVPFCCPFVRHIYTKN